MKTIGTLKHAWKGLFAVAATLAFVPLTSGLAPAQAKPPRHAPAYGYRAKWDRGPGGPRRRDVRRPYVAPRRSYRRYPTRTDRYRRNRTYITRTYRTPYTTYRTRTWNRR